MGDQKHIFLSGEGDAMNQRIIKDNKPEKNLIVEVMSDLKIVPKEVLEIGCSDGWTLNAIDKKHQCKCYGFDPSEQAIAEGTKEFDKLNLTVGTANNLEAFGSRTYDLIILGYCLYVCDPSDLFAIASNIDKSLKDNGLIIIWDFTSPIPYRNSYAFNKSISAYKMDWNKMFTWHPTYRLIYTKSYSHLYSSHVDQPKNSVHFKDHNPDEIANVSVLFKDDDNAFIVNPYSQD